MRIFFFQIAPYCFKPEFFSRVFFNVDLRAKNRAGETQKCHPFFQGVATAKFRPDLCLQRLRWLFFFFFFTAAAPRSTHNLCAPTSPPFFFLATTHALRTVCIQTHLRWIQLFLPPFSQPPGADAQQLRAALISDTDRGASDAAAPPAIQLPLTRGGNRL